MKKKLLSFLLISLAVSGVSYAALTLSSDTGNAATGGWFAAALSGKITFPQSTTNGPLIQFTPSANVSMALSSGDGITYTMGAYHSSGSKLYGTSSVASQIYMRTPATVPPGATAPTEVIPVYTAPNFSTGWTALK